MYSRARPPAPGAALPRARALLRAAAMRTPLALLLLLCAVAAEEGLERAVGDFLEETETDPLLITATREAASAFETPASTEAVSARTIRRRLYRTTPQALAQVPGVMVQETSPGQGSPFLRGFTGYLTLMLVDGIRLNNSVYRSGPNQYWGTVDPFSIASLEVVKGPSSVLYGSDAVGGAVNALTKGPSTWGEGRGRAGHLLYRGATAENSHQGRAEGSATLGNEWGVFGGLSGKHFGDLVAGDPVDRQPDTGYGEWDGDLKIERRFDADTRLVAAFQETEINNAPRTHRLVSAKSFHGTAVGNELVHDFDQERWLAYLQFHRERIGGAIDAVRASLSWQSQSEVRDRLRPPSSPGGPDRRDVEGFDVGTLGFWTQLEGDSAIGRLTGGVEYYRDFVSSFSTANPIQGPVADDASYDLFGLYLQDRVQLGESVELIAGVRFTFAAADAGSVRDPITGAQTSIEDDWSSVVGSARLLYRLVPGRVNLFGGVSQGFRAPNLSDLTRFDSARSNEFEVPAPGLDPEDYCSFELGVKARRDGAWGELAAYYTLIRDQILAYPTGNVDASGAVEVTKANVGDGYVAGIELSGGWSFGRGFTLFGLLNWQYGRVSNFATAAAVETEEYVSRLLPLSGQLGLRWEEPERARFWVETILLLADKADRLSSGDQRDTQRIPPGGTPGYAVLHLRGGWQATEKVALTAAVENLLDTAYRVHGSGHTMPGLNFVFSLSADF